MFGRIGDGCVSHSRNIDHKGSFDSQMQRPLSQDHNLLLSPNLWGIIEDGICRRIGIITFAAMHRLDDDMFEAISECEGR